MNLNSGYPLWLIKNGLPFNYSSLENNRSVDVLIIGGGISGALIAHHLQEAGNDCMVIDSRTIGLGSTCASTSLLQYEIDVPLCELQNKVGIKDAVTSYKLSAEAIGKLGLIAHKIGFIEFEKKNSLYYAAKLKDVSFLEEEYRLRKKNGFRVKMLYPSQLKEEYNITSPAAILSEQAAQTNAYSFTHALHQYNIKKGIPVFDRTEAVSTVYSGKRVIIQTNNGCTIKAKKVIYATGYEAAHYFDKKIVDLNCTYAVCSEHMNKDIIPLNKKVLMWNTANPYLYLRTTNDHRIIIGGRDESFYNPRKRDLLIHLKMKQLTSDFNKLFPGIVFRPEFTWTGTFGTTKDGLPYIGTNKKIPNSYFALGYGGNGITFSLIAAEILTNMVNERKTPFAHIFSFERF